MSLPMKSLTAGQATLSAMRRGKTFGSMKVLILCTSVLHHSMLPLMKLTPENSAFATGWTVFMERRILGKVFGLKTEQFHASQGWFALKAGCLTFAACVYSYQCYFTRSELHSNRTKFTDIVFLSRTLLITLAPIIHSHR